MPFFMASGEIMDSSTVTEGVRNTEAKLKVRIVEAHERNANNPSFRLN